MNLKELVKVFDNEKNIEKNNKKNEKEGKQLTLTEKWDLDSKDGIHFSDG